MLGLKQMYGSTYIHLSWMFVPTHILYWTKVWIIYHGPHSYHIYILNLSLSAGEFEALQLVFPVAFWAVDEPLTFIGAVLILFYQLHHQVISSPRVDYSGYTVYSRRKHLTCVIWVLEIANISWGKSSTRWKTDWKLAYLNNLTTKS